MRHCSVSMAESLSLRLCPVSHRAGDVAWLFAVCFHKNYASLTRQHNSLCCSTGINLRCGNNVSRQHLELTYDVDSPLLRQVCHRLAMCDTATSAPWDTMEMISIYWSEGCWNNSWPNASSTFNLSLEDKDTRRYDGDPSAGMRFLAGENSVSKRAAIGLHVCRHRTVHCVAGILPLRTLMLHFLTTSLSHLLRSMADDDGLYCDFRIRALIALNNIGIMSFSWLLILPVAISAAVWLSRLALAYLRRYSTMAVIKPQ